MKQLFQRIFALESATFSFTPGPISDLALRITLNTTHLLLDAARTHDEIEYESSKVNEKANRDTAVQIESELVIGKKTKGKAKTKGKGKKAAAKKPAGDKANDD